MAEFDEKAKEWDTPDKKERAEHIGAAISSQLPLSNSMTAFEYGCGTGLLSFALKDKLGAMTLADVSDGMLGVLEKKIQQHQIKDMKPLKLNLITDPLPKARFDIIYTMMTLHHISDTEKILRKFYTLLKPGGYLCIADLDKEDGSFHGKEVENVHRGFNRDNLDSLAMDIGFSPANFITA